MKMYYLIELGPVNSGMIIRSQEMADEKAQEFNMHMIAIKWVTEAEIKIEREKLRQLGYRVAA